MTTLTRPLSLVEYALARTIVRKRSPSLLGALPTRELSSLNEDQRQALIDTLADEWCEVGFGADDQINDEGRAIKGLIDRFNRKDDPSPIEALRIAFRRFEKLKFSRANGLDLTDAYVDLAEEDGYLAGLCSSYLSHGRLPQRTVTMDSSIDRRLWRSSAKSVAERRSLIGLLSYRALMHQLTELLNSLIDSEHTDRTVREIAGGRDLEGPNEDGAS